MSDDTLVAVEFIAKNIGKIALAVFAYLAVFDVVGVVLCWFLDVIDEGNTGVYYARSVKGSRPRLTQFAKTQKFAL